MKKLSLVVFAFLALAGYSQIVTTPSGLVGISNNSNVNIDKDGLVMNFGESGFTDKYIQIRKDSPYGVRFGLKASQVGSTTGIGLIQAGGTRGFGIKVDELAQWDAIGDPEFLIQTDGNVGIGTVQPVRKLHVNGDMGIGKFSDGIWPGLSVSYVDGGSGTTIFKHLRWGGDFYFKRQSSTGDKTQVFFGGNTHHWMDIYNGNNEVKVRLHSGSDSYVNGGNFGIGTTTPTHKLEVNGTIRSKEVKVEASSWPDYVFEPDYKLESIESVEAFIESNGHLPEIPSAAEMEAEGVKLGEMNRLLLKKIEELTLYTIEQEERLDSQDQLINELFEKIEELNHAKK